MNISKILFFGDVVIGSRPHNDLFSPKLQNFIADHDLVGCNLEAPTSGSGAPIIKAGPHIANDPFVIPILRETGISVFNLANNHIFDFGPAGLEKTLSQLDGAYAIGAGMARDEAYALKCINLNSINVGLLSYSEAQFGALVNPEFLGAGYAWVNAQNVEADISAARNIADIVIVQVHAGAEGVCLPIPEWRHRYRDLINAGAHAVIAHHPHVAQGWEVYRGAPIFYSLGNFYIDFQSKVGAKESLGLAVSLDISKTGIIATQCHWTCFDGNSIDIVENSELDSRLKTLNNMLASPDYDKLANKQALELWERSYRRLHAISSGNLPPHPSFRDGVRYLANIIAPSRFRLRNEVLMFHHLRIETHRWCIERALSNIIRASSPDIL